MSIPNSCPAGYIDGCGQVQALADETPKFDKEIIRDIRPVDSWIGNIKTRTEPIGSPTEITQDRFRAVAVNSAKTWNRTVGNGVGCSGAPCDPVEHVITWGTDRLTYYTEDFHLSTPLMCFDQLMAITEAVENIEYIISDILRPATARTHSSYLRKRHLLWSKYRLAANSLMSGFTYQWSLGGINNDEEEWFDCSVPPSQLYKLVPQMLQRQYQPLMMVGYAGKNPFKNDMPPIVEICTDMDTCWELGHLGGQTGVGGTPSVLGNWRFAEFTAADKYWKYGFTHDLGNFMARVDTDGMRFNYVGDMGAGWNGGNGNRYRYQWVEPYVNSITTGAGGAAGLGSDFNPAWLNAQYRISQVTHKAGMELLVADDGEINPEMPFMHRNFGGKWQFVMHDLGADANGVAIQNKRGNKGQFIADFRNKIRPGNTELMQAWFHKGESMPVPQISTYAADPGYPTQSYVMAFPPCPVVAPWTPVYGTVQAGQWGPYGTQDGPVPQPPTPVPAGSYDQ
jgi:hypothetical protein